MRTRQLHIARLRLTSALTLAAGLVLSVMPAAGQVLERAEPGAIIDQELLVPLESLDAPVLEVRDSAEEEVLEILLHRARAGDEQIEAVLEAFEAWLVTSQESMGPEGVARAERIATELYRRLPYAGMGMAPSELANGSIRIETVVQGFHVARILQVGDVVRSLAGQRLRGDEHMRTLIVSFRPGDPIDVEYVRAGQINRGSITLGAFERLANARPLAGALVRNAWRERFRRLIATEANEPNRTSATDENTQEVIGAGHGPEAWINATDSAVPTPSVDLSGRIRPSLNPRQTAMSQTFVVQTRPGIEFETSPQRFFRLTPQMWKNEVSNAPTAFEPVLENELTQLEILESTFIGQLADLEHRFEEIKAAKGREPTREQLDVLRTEERAMETRYTAVQAELVRLRQRMTGLRNRLGVDAPGDNDNP